MNTETNGAPPVDFQSASEFYGAPANDVPEGTDEKVANGTKPKPGGVIFLDHDDLFVEDPPNESLVVPELGIGPGPVTAIFGQGFVGKTIIACALGMAIALGRDVWERFRCKQGVWVHFDYEQGKRKTKKRIQQFAAGFGVSKEALRERIRIAVYPSVDLTTADALKHYVEAMRGATIATMDALKGLTPGVDENSSAMRDYMRIIAKASEETGCMVVLIHHTGKLGDGGGKKPRKEYGRGSQAIFDECQSVFVITGSKEEDKFVTHEKDRELEEAVAPFYVRITSVDPAGEQAGTGDEEVSLGGSLTGQRRGLRVSVVERVAAAKGRNDTLARRMIDLIRENPGRGTEGIRELAKKHLGVGGKDTVDAIIEDLIKRELVEDRGTARAHHFHVPVEA